MSNNENENLENQDSFQCGKSSTFLKPLNWQRLASHLSSFGILTGTFNCQRDAYFCQMKGWNRPQLVLGLIKYDKSRTRTQTTSNSPKEFVELFQYANCKSNGYDDILDWIELMLRRRLVLLAKQEPPKNDTNLFKLNLIYSMQEQENGANEFSAKTVPLYYSTMSVKYNSRAVFHVTNEEKARLTMPECFSQPKPNNKFNELRLRTPIYLLLKSNENSVDVCYNYGKNLNELPNYAQFDLFLKFLYPDMNIIFMISFFFLNAYLFMLFFEYNESLLKQLLHGLIYLCIFNFVLFSIWTLLTNASSKELVRVSKLINHTSKNLLVWLRHLMLYNEFSQTLFAHLRYVTFYHVYIQPLAGFLFYLLLSIVYYFHTRRLFYARNSGYEPLSNRNGNEKKPHHHHLIDRLKRIAFKNSEKKSKTAETRAEANDSAELTAEIGKRALAMTANNNNSLVVSYSSPFNQEEHVYNRSRRNSESSSQTAPVESIGQMSPPSSLPTSSSSSALASQSSPNRDSQPYFDIDIEISVSELIDQINGLTTIWLESSTHADKMLSLLPSIEYCKCFYVNTIKIHNYDETDTERDGTTTEEDEETKCEPSSSETSSSSPLLDSTTTNVVSEKKAPSESCECGRNNELNKFLDENRIKLFDRIRRECSICLEKYQFGCLIIPLPCGHWYHRRCIYEWFMNSKNCKCPVCRTCFYKFKKTV